MCVSLSISIYILERSRRKKNRKKSKEKSFGASSSHLMSLQNATFKYKELEMELDGGVQQHCSHHNESGIIGATEFEVSH